MTAWVAVPAKAAGEAKTRLAPALAPPARAALATAMLAHVLATVALVHPPARTLLVGPARFGLPDGVGRLEDRGSLGAGLAAARDAAAAAGATRIVWLAGDLPRLAAGDVAALLGLDDGVLGLASDRAGTGTNALSLPLPGALAFAPAYGPGSLAAHLAEAARLGLPTARIARDGLATDVDLPADLALLPPALAPLTRR